MYMLQLFKKIFFPFFPPPLCSFCSASPFSYLLILVLVYVMLYSVFIIGFIRLPCMPCLCSYFPFPFLSLNLDPWNTSLPLSCSIHPILFSLFVFCLTQDIPYSMLTCVSGVFHSILYFPVVSIFWHVSNLSLLISWVIPLYRDSSFCLSSHLLISIQAASGT